MLEFQSVIKKFSDQFVLGPLQIVIPDNIMLGVLGPNGSGKSTFLRLITGNTKTTDGRVLWNNKPIQEESHSEIAYLPDINPFPNWMSVLDAIQFFSFFYLDFDRNKCLDYFEQFHVSLKKKISHLSKGDQEKVKLILILSRKAKLFLLDEPLEGLDICTRKKMLQLIVNLLNEKCSVILSSHYINEMDQILTNVLFLKDGKIALFEDKDTIQAEMGLSLEDIYRDMYLEENTDVSFDNI